MLKMSIKPSPELGRLFRRLGDDFPAGVSAGLTHVVEALEARAVKEAPVRTSNLVNSITSYITRGAQIQGIVQATAKYAEYVHEGTGLYGPKKQKIVPTKKKALYWPGAAHPVRSVKGMRPNPFFARAIKQVDGTREMEAGLIAYLTRRGW